MARKITRRPATAKKRGVFLWNLLVTGIGLIIAVAVDVILSWSGIVAQHDGLAAGAHLAISIGFTAFVIVLTSAAGAMKADPRPEQKRRAGWAMLAAVVMMLIVPAPYAAQSLTFQDRLAAHLEYVRSGGADDDRLVRNNVRDYDVSEREDAKARLDAHGARPVSVQMDPLSYLWVAGVLLLNMLAVRAARRAEPETPAQAQARRRKAKAPQEPRRGKLDREPLVTADIISIRR